MERGYKIIFLNQVAGRLFCELTEDLAQEWNPCLILTGDRCSSIYKDADNLRVKNAPKYDRRSYFNRLLSWLKYTIYAVRVIWGQSSDALIFIVSNPPFLGFVGLLASWVRKQRFVILMYDIYPDILTGLNRFNRVLFVRFLNLLNKLVYDKSSLIMTISQDMAVRLQSKLSVQKDDAKTVLYFPLWADTDFIRPVPKDKNWFAEKHGLLGKTVVLYSGRIGPSQDFKAILELAKRMKEYQGVHFLIIAGEGKWFSPKKIIQEWKLDNTTFLPLQAESVLPYSMASGDIGLIVNQVGIEHYMIPSKIYYYMAAGVVPIVLSSVETDITRMVNSNNCGLCIKDRDMNCMAEVIVALCNDERRFEQLKKAARKVAVRDYSRKNTERYIDALSQFIC